MNDAALAQSSCDVDEVCYRLGQSGARPWGSWQVLAVGPRYIVKRVEVLPGGRLSLQYHEFRAERWTLVQGAGEAEIGEERRILEVGAHVLIPVGVSHRLSNVGDEPLVVIEVQMGRRLDEADIVRVADDYGRVRRSA